MYPASAPTSVLSGGESEVESESRGLSKGESESFQKSEDGDSWFTNMRCLLMIGASVVACILLLLVPVVLLWRKHPPFDNEKLRNGAAMATGKNNNEGVAWWLSTQDGEASLSQQPTIQWAEPGDPGEARDDSVEVVVVDETQQFQEIFGIGTSLEASTAFHIAHLGAIRAADVLTALFSVEHGVGFNLARVTVGTSDFTPPPFYTYDDLDDPNATDTTLKKFSIEADETYVLPLISGALDASRQEGEDRLLIFASPWSPPAWMKTSGRLEGGSLHWKYHMAYAKYLLAFIQAYAQHGIPIHALTVQNEPLAQELRYPTSQLLPIAEVRVIRWLGSLLKSSGLDTRIWCFDHNWDNLWYPIKVLRNKTSSEFIEGTAFHHYKGSPESMTKLHNLFPEKKIFFTEGSTFGAQGAAQIVDIFRNWASTYVAWVTMLDTELQPNVGPFNASPPMLLYDHATRSVQYRFEYYMYGQFSKFIRRGAVRIWSTLGAHAPYGLGLTRGMVNVAFANSKTASGPHNAGSLVVVAVNAGKRRRQIQLRCGNRVTQPVSLPGESIATFQWHSPRCLGTIH